MKKSILFCLMFFILSFSVFSLSITPTSWSFEGNDGQSYQQVFQITNNENHSIDVTLSSSGVIGSWIYFTPGSLTVNQGSTAQFSSVVVIPSGMSAGTYTGSIEVNYNGSTISIPVNVTVTKWKYSQSASVSTNEVLHISPLGYDIEVISVTDKVDVKVSKSGYTLTVQQLGVGETIEYDDLLIELTDRYVDTAVFSIKTTQEVTLSKESQQEESDCYMQPSISKYVTSIVQDTTANIDVMIKNKCKGKTIKIQNVLIQNSVYTPEGLKPLSIYGSVPSEINPGESVKLTLKIDSRGMDVNQYSPYLVVYGDADGEELKTNVYFDIFIVKSASQEVNATISFNVPQTVNKNQDFQITVTNIGSDEDILLMQTSNIITKEQYKQGNQWFWKGNINTAGTHTLIFYVLKNGQIKETKTFQITVTEQQQQQNATINIEVIMPENNNGMIKFIAKDQNGQLISNPQYTLDVRDSNGNLISTYYTNEVTATSGNQYCITVYYNGISTSKCVTIANKEIVIEISPNPPVAGQTVTITAKDKSNNQIITNANLLINGVSYGNPASFVAEEKPYDVKASAEGYKEAQTSFVVTTQTSGGGGGGSGEQPYVIIGGNETGGVTTKKSSSSWWVWLLIALIIVLLFYFGGRTIKSRRKGLLRKQWAHEGPLKVEQEE